MSSVDIFVLGVIILVMLVIVFLFLMLRRTVLGFREGFERGRR